MNVKLNEDANPELTKSLLGSKPGVIGVTQTFPEETTSDLGRLYLLDVELKHMVEAISSLNDDPGIEYAEPSAPRKLIKKLSI